MPPLRRPRLGFLRRRSRRSPWCAEAIAPGIRSPYPAAYPSVIRVPTTTDCPPIGITVWCPYCAPTGYGDYLGGMHLKDLDRFTVAAFANIR